MPFSKQLVCFFILLLNTYFSTVMAGVRLEKDQHQFEVSNEIYFKEDKNGTLLLRDLISLEPRDWQKNQREVPNFGFTSSVYWFWFEVHNDHPSKKSWFLEVAYPPLDYVDIHVVDEGQVKKSYYTGDRLPFKNRPASHRNFTVPLEINPGERLEIYLRVETSSSLQLPIKFWSPQGFYHKEQVHLLMNGFFFGVVLVMVFYNLFLFIAIKDISFIYYVLHILTFAFFEAELQGFAYQYLWPNAVWWHDKSMPFFILASSTFSCIFSIEILGLKQSKPWVFNIFKYCYWFTGILTPVTLLLPYKTAIALAVSTSVVICSGLLICGFIRWKQGFVQAKYYTIAWSSFILGVILAALNKAGIIPRNFYTENGVQIGMVLEVMLLSFALAEMINRERKLSYQASKKALSNEKKMREAQEQAFNYQKEAKENLEREVERQTVKLRNQNDQLKELDQQKTHFFQNISHELRTPLTLIMNPLEDLLNGDPENKKLDLANKNSRRLYRLVNQLLDFQKIAAGKQKLKLKPVNFSKFVFICGEYFSSACSTKGIEFFLTFNGKSMDTEEFDEKVYIDGEIDSLEKVVFNFLSNALKYTPEAGKIELGLLVSENIKNQKVRIFVKDSGVGISDQGKEKLFKVFSQVDEGETREFEGTGLGLALAKELTEAMGGRIGVESKEGEGSTFYSDFPLIPSLDIDEEDFKVKDWHIYRTGENTAIFEEELSGEIDLSTAMSRKVILVVDDLKDMRELISLTLKKQNYRVINAPNGQKGFEAAKTYKPNLIVTDWMMPVKTGPELIEGLKSDSDLSSIPVILLTAKSDEESKVMGTECGADGFLGKPFNENELLSLVKNLISLKQKENFYAEELRLAAILQNSVHKDLSGVYGNFKVSTFFLSSMEVGGDFMGIYRLNSDLLMLAQCDISGHGPQASLISFYLRGVVENLINQIQISDGPEDILRALIKKADEQLDKNIGDTQFGTFFFSILSESSNLLFFQGGGHPPAILIRDGEEVFLTSKNMPLGLGNMLGDKVIPVEKLTLGQKFKILIVTDSVTELPGQAFGTDILGSEKFLRYSLEFLNQEDLDAQEYASYMLKETKNKFFEDDCSIMIVSNS